MHWIFVLFRFTPYWALPIALVGFETGVYFKRRGRQRSRWACWALSGAFMVIMALWFYYRGDIHSDDWVRGLLG